jgi:hypothetical protein
MRCFRLVPVVSLLAAFAVLAAPVAAAETTTGPFDAIVLVSEADLSALLASGALGDYRLVSAAELGLDEAALAGLGLLGEDAVLTPEALGLVSADRHLLPVFFGGFAPFFRGFATVSGMLTAVFRGTTLSLTFSNVRVPVFRFRPFLFPSFLPGKILIIRTCC